MLNVRTFSLSLSPPQPPPGGALEYDCAHVCSFFPQERFLYRARPEFREAYCRERSSVMVRIFENHGDTQTLRLHGKT